MITTFMLDRLEYLAFTAATNILKLDANSMCLIDCGYKTLKNRHLNQMQYISFNTVCSLE